MSDRKPFIGGNWKMNTSLASGSDLARSISDAIAPIEGVDVAVFPPMPYLMAVGGILHDRQSTVKLGAQDVWYESEGAFTGEVSVAMLADCGVKVVLVGHSERRHVIGESDALVGKKAAAVLAGGLECILCVGEKLDEREAGQTDVVNERQLRAGLAGVGKNHVCRLTIAYEPVWAIGTGKTATPEDAQQAHERIRAVLADMYGDEIAGEVRIQYGGSMKPSNAGDLLGQADIDGGLIGGASLKVEDFTSILRAAAGMAAGAGL